MKNQNPLRRLHSSHIWGYSYFIFFTFGKTPYPSAWFSTFLYSSLPLWKNSRKIPVKVNLKLLFFFLDVINCAYCCRFIQSFILQLDFYDVVCKRLHKHLQAISSPYSVRVRFCNKRWSWIFLLRHHRFVIIANPVYQTRSLGHADRSHTQKELSYNSVWKRQRQSSKSKERSRGDRSEEKFLPETFSEEPASRASSQSWVMSHYSFTAVYYKVKQYSVLKGCSWWTSWAFWLSWASSCGTEAESSSQVKKLVPGPLTLSRSALILILLIKPHFEYK